MTGGSPAQSSAARVVAAVVAAVVVTVVGAALAIGYLRGPPSSSAPPGGAVVPYRPQPLASEPLDDRYLRGQPAPAATPGCRPAELRAQMPALRDGAVEAHLRITFQNGGATCALSSPTVAVLTPTGAPTGVEARPDPAAQRGPTRVLVPSGARFFTDVRIAGSFCAALPRPTLRLALVLGSAGTRTLDPVPAPTCDPARSDVGAVLTSSEWIFEQEPSEPVNAFDGAPLTVVLDFPATLPEAGGPVRYTVTLTNAGSTDFPLRPCPPYNVVAGEGAVVTEQVELLNCDAAPPAVAAGESLTFEMITQLPAGKEAGRLTWVLGEWPSDDAPRASLEYRLTG